MVKRCYFSLVSISHSCRYKIFHVESLFTSRTITHRNYIGLTFPATQCAYVSIRTHACIFVYRNTYWVPKITFNLYVRGSEINFSKVIIGQLCFYPGYITPQNSTETECRWFVAKHWKRPIARIELVGFYKHIFKLELSIHRLKFSRRSGGPRSGKFIASLTREI